LTDERGAPVSVVLTAANVHDKWLAGKTLDAIAITHTNGKPIRPEHLCMDKGYDYKDTEQEVRKRGVIPHIRRRGEPALFVQVKGKPRRWAVERTISWHNRYRAILIRWERKSCNYLAMLQLASALILFQMSSW
jgi:transposase